MASTGTPTSGLSHDAQVQHPPSTGKTNIASDGSLVSSADPSISASATAGQKLKGDVGGAVSGSIGSMQAAAGAMLRNKGMEEKGMAKMQAEDERLGAKRGIMPVGSGQRHTTTQTTGHTTGTGTTGTENMQ
ncbi:uncharacterized protein GGS22DRAFT_160524 [Annulohypoxylon maeteangense]|uniref:uncharacterized protein n=1 Tax=Annulohypoxylon maeteangense TaxID=1927788 RepID=UPI0020079B21|nr:uncharacterized protein GGS22DRAFT_160524 [Annulohypoxylon maeteangense]KAI0886304.1 hypothetical protein GGS22DRAFT_160524 [Annulohypoxylon maeteangense]